MAPAKWKCGRWAAVAAYLSVQVVLGLQDTPPGDEVRHLRDGAAIIERGRVDVNPEHPPLVKVLSALALPASQRRHALEIATGDPLTADARFAVSLHLVGRSLLRARIPAILLAALGLFAFGSLFAKLSPAAGLVATVILGASPPFLAHGHYVTTDMAPVTFILLAVWALSSLRWPWAAVLGGLFLGASLAAKFSAPLILPFVVLFAFFRLKWRGVAVVVVCSLLVTAGIEAYASRAMTRSDLDALATQAFLGGGLGGPAPPSPSLARLSKLIVRFDSPLGAYWIGFWDVAHRSGTSEWIDYWMGRIVVGPEPLYPIATLAFKNDLPLLALAVLGGLLATKRHPRWWRNREAWVPVSGAMVYLLLASRSSLHLGIRHLLPLVACLSALATLGLLNAHDRLRALSWSLIAAHLLAAALDYPYFTSSRNLASRLFLPKTAAYDLSDDWGQDLGRFLNENQGSVAYVPVVHSRNPTWLELFPGLRSQACGSCSLFLVDRISLDVLDASHRDDVPPAARQTLASFRTLLDEVATVRHRGTPVPIDQPTLRLFRISSAGAH